MFHALRLLTQEYIVKHRRSTQNEITLTQPNALRIQDKTPQLNYKDAYTVILVSECEANGKEIPVAIAFHNGQNLIIMYLHELSELE